MGKERYWENFFCGPISPDTADGRTIYTNGRVLVVESGPILFKPEFRRVTTFFIKVDRDFKLGGIGIDQTPRLLIDGFPLESFPLEISWALFFDDKVREKYYNKVGKKYSGIFEFKIDESKYQIGFPLTEDELSQSKLSLLPQTSDGRIAVPFLQDEREDIEVLFVIPRPWIDWPRNCFEGITPKTSPEEIVKIFDSLGFGIVIS